MGRFVADPDLLIKEGNGIVGISDEFLANVNDTYDTLDNLVANEYMSPEALAIKKEIDTYREDLNKMGLKAKKFVLSYKNNIVQSQRILDLCKEVNNENI